MSTDRFSDLVVAKGFVAAVAVGLVARLLALAQEIFLALGAGKRQRYEFAALMRAITEWLFTALAANAEKVFAILLQCNSNGLIVGDGSLRHVLLSCDSGDTTVLKRRNDIMLS
jgi:hypothetical protein